MLLLTAMISSIGPASGQIFWGNVLVNQYQWHDQLNATGAIGRDGIVHVVWEDYTNGTTTPAVFYSRSLDGGKTWSSGVPVAHADGVIRERPSVAVSDDGRVHVVWADLTNVNLQAIFYSQSANGQYWTSKVPITGHLGTRTYGITPQIVYSNKSGTACYLHVIYSGSSIVVGGPVRYTYSADCGSSWTTPATVDSLGCDASVAAAPDNTLAVAYVNYKGFIMLMYRINDKWSARIGVSEGRGSIGNKDPTVAFDWPVPVGQSYPVQVAWADSRSINWKKVETRNDWDIYYKRSPSRLKSVRVNDKAPGDLSEQSQPWISVYAGNMPKIAWTDKRNRTANADIRYSQSTDGGLTFIPSIRVNDDNTIYEQARPMVFEYVGEAPPLHGFYIVWHDLRNYASGFGYDIYITADGNAVLEWCGTTGYETDGVNPDTGNFRTVFTYCVKYRSSAGDPPASGYPDLQITGPFGYSSARHFDRMAFVNPATRYRGGAYYYFDVILPCGSNQSYAYTFSAFDVKMRPTTPPTLSGTGPLLAATSFMAVDIAGVGYNGDNLVAASHDRCVSIFSFNTGQRYHTEIVGFDVDYVRLSQAGDALAILGNDRPFSETSQAHLVYYTIDLNQPSSWTLYYTYNFSHSALSYRPFDMNRNGSLVAVGTGAAYSFPPTSDDAWVYVLQKPAAPLGTPLVAQHHYGRRPSSLQFSGNGNRLAIGTTMNPREANVGLYNVITHSAQGPPGPSINLRWESRDNDYVYSVATDYLGAYVAAGHGWSNNITLRDSNDPTHPRGYSTDLGTIDQLVMSDQNVFTFSGARQDGSFGRQAFTLFNVTLTPMWNPPSYSPEPTSTWASRVDMAVQTNAQFLVGCSQDHSYFWVGHSGMAPGPNPTQEFPLWVGSYCTGVAMTFGTPYGGNSSTARTAILDSAGTLNLFTSDAGGTPHVTRDWLLHVVD